MLTIKINGDEMFNEETGEFLNLKEIELNLEHSLLSVSKWESKYQKPFLTSDKSPEEIVNYVKCMTINHNILDEYYKFLTEENLSEVMAYIQAPMTATTFKERGSKGSREIITAELIYYWMVAQNIPFECQKWHLNKLMTLIRICSIKSTPPKKMGKRATMQHNNALNAARRAQMGTSG